MSSDKSFACTVNCMDGRVQDVVKKYIQEKYNVDYIDVITEPGPIKILADNSDMPVIEDIKKCIGVSVNKHGSKLLAIVGHFDCAGNPVSKEVQIQQLKEAKKTVENFGFGKEVILLWVEGDWQTVEKI